MDDSVGLARSVAQTIAIYPIQVAKTLIQIGYEPTPPDHLGRLPNVFSYICTIQDRRGYLSLYTGFKFYLPAVVLKQCSYDLMSLVTNHKKDTKNSDASEIIAICLRESALKIHSTIISYPLLTLSIGCISAAFFNTKEPVEYTVDALYKGIVPKLIFEVVMVWVTIITRRLTAGLTDDELIQAALPRIPPFLVGTYLQPLNLVSTVMADQGRSKLNPRFDDWRQCFKYLSSNGQLNRGSGFFRRRDVQVVASWHTVTRYF